MSALLTVLGDTPGPSQTVSIASVNKSSLAISGASLLTLGAPVKVLQADCLWLGEVIERHPDGAATIQIVHTLRNLTELTRLAARFTGSLPGQPEPEPTLS